MGKLSLNTGHEVPLIGCKYIKKNLINHEQLKLFSVLTVGTYLIRGTEQTNKVLDEALTAGYRLFDTAHMYNNERFLGQAFKELLPKHKLTRNDIFITTKFGKNFSNLPELT
jgi:diketogulonate reductase-like aldo/keto reductase